MKAFLATIILAVPLLAGAAPVLPSRSFVQEFDTIAQLLASNPQQLTTTYTCKGLNAVNDGLGGNFYYFSGDTTATNETDCFAFSNGRLRRFYEAVTASRILVTGGPAGTNYANNLGIGESMIIAYVIPTLGSVGNAAVFDGSGRITNGVVTPTISDGTNTLVQQLGPFTVDYYPIAIATNKLGDGHLYKVGGTNVGFNGQFIWGSSGQTTNVLFRSGNDLIYTNSNTLPAFVVKNVGGNQLRLVPNSNVAQLKGEGGVDLTWTNSTEKAVRFWANYIHPLQSGIRLGGDLATSPIQPFSILSLDGSYDQYGFIDTSANYSRLRVSHSGTNGAAIFDSQSAGAAGAARNFIFSTNGVTRFTLDGVNATFIASNAGQSSSYGTDSGGTGIITPGNSLLRIYGDTDARKNLVVNAETGASQGLTVYGQSINNIITAQSGFVNVQLNANNVGSSLPTGYGFSAYNAQAATAGQVQNSPSVYWRGTAWSTNDAASELVGMVSHIAPISGGARPTGKLTFTPIVHTNTLSSVFYISTEGPVKLASLTKAQKTALTDVSDGMIVYQTDNTPGLRAYVNGAWVMVSTVADP